MHVSHGTAAAPSGSCSCMLDACLAPSGVVLQVLKASKNARTTTTKAVKEYLHHEEPGSAVISAKYIIINEEAAARAKKGAPGCACMTHITQN